MRSGTSLIFMQTVAETGPGQRMIVRLAQNRDGTFLPHDLIPHHPVLKHSAPKHELITLLDLDHFREAREAFQMEHLSETAWELHDGLDIMFRDLVTDNALSQWS